MGQIQVMTRDGFVSIDKLNPRTSQELERGARIYGELGYGFSASGIFAATGDEDGHIIEIGGAHRRMNDCESMLPISRQFGIGLYWDDCDPDFRFDEETICAAERAADIQKRWNERADERAKQAYTRKADELRKKYAGILEPLADSYDKKGATNNLRKLLKYHFPTVKFSVRRENYDTIYIKFTDGAPITEEVERVAQQFNIRHFDGMTDYEDIINTPFADTFGGLGYIFVEREMSDKVRERLTAEVLERFPILANNKDIPVDIFRKELDGLKHDENREIFDALQCYNYWINAATLVHSLFDKMDFTPKVEKPQPKVNDVQSKTEPVSAANDLQIIDYSERAIAVIGNTKPIKEILKQLGGRFNLRLTCGAGWVFPKSKTNELRAALNL